MMRRDFSKLLGISVGLVWVTGCSTGAPAIPGAPGDSGPIAPPTQDFTYTVGNHKLVFTESGTFRLDRAECQVVKLNDDGTDGLTLGGFEADGPLINFPVSVCTTKSGKIVVLERGSSCATAFDGAGKVETLIGHAGNGANDLLYPAAMLIDASDHLWITDTGNNRIQVYSLDGALVRSIGKYGSDSGNFNAPRAIALDSDGDVHVLDSGNGRVQIFDANGKVKAIYGKPKDEALVGSFRTANEIEFGPDKKIYVVDAQGGAIHIFDEDGIGKHYLTVKDTSGKLMRPLDVVFPPQKPAYIWAVPAEEHS